MATNNKALLTKFAQLFSSNDFLSTTQGLLLARDMWNFLVPDGSLALPQEPESALNAISQRFEALLTDNRIKDKHLLAYLVTLTPQGIMAMGSDLVADIMESPAYQALKPDLRQAFDHKLNDVYGYLNVDYKVMENLNTVVLNEESLRRMVDASSETERAKKTAHGKIDNALTAFDNAYRNVDIVALGNGPKHYGNVFTPQANLLGKMRASYINILGEKEGNKTADINEDLINMQTSQGEKNAYLISAVAAHDETVMAIFKRRNVDAKKYDKAFLGSEIDGSDKNNQHFLPNLMKTIGGAGKTFGIAASASFAVNLMSNIPVVGNFVGPAMAIATVVKKAHSEYKQAAQIAAMQNRTLDRRDAARIAVNTAASVAPYALTMAAGPLGRGIGALGMGIKSFFTDINQKKAKLRDKEKLAVTDYLASAGKSILNGAAVWLGGKVGSTLGSAVVNNFDGQGFVNDMRAKMGLQTENVANEEVSLDAPQTYEEAMEQMQQMQAGHKIITDLESGAKGLQDLQDQQMADLDAQLEAQEYQTKLSGLQKHKFDLTDATRSTANPDADRMYQANGAGHYQQNDWYNSEQYKVAIDTLHNAGVEDADGALRNLAGARMFKGGEFKTELDNLLNGKLTANTIDKIIEADSILDEHAGLISNSTAHVKQPAGLAPERVTDYKIMDEPMSMSPKPELVTDAEIPTDPAFGPERMTDYNIADQKELTDAEFDKLYFGPDRRVIFNEFEKTPEPEPVAENDPTFGPERMTDYNIDDVAEKMTEEPSFGPERMTDYDISSEAVEPAPEAAQPEPVAEPTAEPVENEIDEDELYFGPNRRVIYTEDTSVPETELDTPAVENSNDYVPETDWGTETLNDGATFGLNRMSDYQINNDAVSDWRDNSFDSMMDNAVDDITSKYQLSTAEQIVEHAEESTTTDSVAEETNEHKPTWRERRAEAKAARQEAKAAKLAAKQAGEDYSDILDGSKPDWLVGQQTNLQRVGNGMWVMEPDSDSVMEDYNAWKSAQTALREVEHTLDDGGREM